MKNTWMPVAGGLMIITNGVIGLAVSFCLSLVYVMMGDALYFMGIAYYWLPLHFVAVLWWLTVPLAVSSALALAGGIFALQRKSWWLAMAGSFAATIVPVFLPGLVAILLMSLSRDEFTPIDETRANVTADIGR
jgi:hypothetical protein